MARTPQCAPAPKVGFVRQHTSWPGDVFRRYAASGQITEVRVRTGRKGRDGSGRNEPTDAEAAQIATWRLTARPGPVRFVRRFTSDFTGLTWDVYENAVGAQYTVCITPGGFLGCQTLTRRQTRAIAVEQLRGAR